MKLMLDEKTLRAVWGGSGEYWLSRIDCRVHSAADLDCDDTDDLLSNGFIPFINISNEEIIRAYVKHLGNKKIGAVLDKLSGDEYVDTFWKYFNAYSDISAGFDAFESKFVLDKAIEWCNDNSIEYSVEV